MGHLHLIMIKSFHFFLCITCFYPFPLMILLSNSIGHMSSDCPELLGTLDVKHLIIKEDVRSDLMKDRPLRSPSQKEGLIYLQSPAP